MPAADFPLPESLLQWRTIWAMGSCEGSNTRERIPLHQWALPCGRIHIQSRRSEASTFTGANAGWFRQKRVILQKHSKIITFCWSIPFANNNGSFKADDEDGKIYNFFLFRQEADRKSAADVSVKTMERSCHFWAEFTRRYGFNLIRGIPCDAIE